MAAVTVATVTGNNNQDCNSHATSQQLVYCTTGQFKLTSQMHMQLLFFIAVTEQFGVYSKATKGHSPLKP